MLAVYQRNTDNAKKNWNAFCRLMRDKAKLLDSVNIMNTKLSCSKTAIPPSERGAAGTSGGQPKGQTGTKKEDKASQERQKPLCLNNATCKA
jgi:hypothetical protein